MSDIKQTRMTKIQKLFGQSVGCITLLLLAAFPGALVAEPALTLSDSDFWQPVETHAFRSYYPVTLEQLVNPGISIRSVSFYDVDASDDLLARLRRGFSLERVVNNRVQSEINWLKRHPDYIDRVFNRAQRFLPYITQQLDEQGLPLELALLPMVEHARALKDRNVPTYVDPSHGLPIRRPTRRGRCDQRSFEIPDASAQANGRRLVARYRFLQFR